jgi:DNA-binding XRE family transcriptional regulator
LKKARSQTTGKVLLIWDQASWHTSKQVQSFLEDLSRFETLRLPKRAPEANPMEDLWRELKEQVAACLERSLDALRESCRRYFQNLSPQQALRTAGIGYEECCSVDLLRIYQAISGGYGRHLSETREYPVLGYLTPVPMFLCVFQGLAITMPLHSPEYRRFCRMLVDARNERSITQVELAQELGKPQSFVSKIENGERRVDLIEFLNIADALNLDAASFINHLKNEIDNDSSIG